MGKSITIQENIPEYIEASLQGTMKFYRIPTCTDNAFRAERRNIVKDAYTTMLSNAQGIFSVRNNFLEKDIFVNYKESYYKASNNAVRNWQSTYAVLKLPTVIKNAIPHDENFIVNDIKDGTQKGNKYIQLIKLRYTFTNKSLIFMNFTIELVIGKKKEGKHVQYSVEYIKKAGS